MNLGHARKTRLLVPFMGVLEIFTTSALVTFIGVYPRALFPAEYQGKEVSSNRENKRQLYINFTLLN